MDFLPYLGLSLGMGVLVYFLCTIIPFSAIWTLIIGLLVGVVAYLGCSFIFLGEIREEAKNLLNKVKK